MGAFRGIGLRNFPLPDFRDHQSPKPPFEDRRLATVASDHFSRMRTMFVAYWVFILAVFAFFFYVGLANR
jgi:hypothetical protein